MSPDKDNEDLNATVVEEEVLNDNDVETTEEESVEVDEVQELKNKVSELEEIRLRMAAENQNTRKRLVKQQQDAYKYRHQDILRDLAEVIDNFERAIESSVESSDFSTFHEGILMIEKQFSGMLAEKYGLERIGAEGEAFDPAAHEAMMMEESPDVETETVKQVYQAGYRLHDRVLRPAKVVVAKPAVDTPNEQNEEGAE